MIPVILRSNKKANPNISQCRFQFPNALVIDDLYYKEFPIIQHLQLTTDVNVVAPDDSSHPQGFHLRFENLDQIIGAEVLSVSIQTDSKPMVILELHPTYAGMHIPISFLQKDSVCTLLENYPFEEAGKGIVVRAWFEPAMQSSWKISPTQDAYKISVPYRRIFATKEYERIKLGVIPMAIEDHWFAYFENDCLYWHHSWTGQGVFEVEIEQTPSGAAITSVVANNDPVAINGNPDLTNILEAYLLNALSSEAERILDL